MGEDALSDAAVSTSKWDAADYARVGAFVAKLGGAAVDLLDPQPGERILDVGCGEGTMTRKIIERGAIVLVIDNYDSLHFQYDKSGGVLPDISPTDPAASVRRPAAIDRATRCR